MSKFIIKSAIFVSFSIRFYVHFVHEMIDCNHPLISESIIEQVADLLRTRILSAATWHPQVYCVIK